MSKFYDFTHIKKTRTRHWCAMCNRLIPEKHKAHYYVGEFEGDFQDWYLCDFCYSNVLGTLEDGEYLDIEYFWKYFRENLLRCPVCGKSDEYEDKIRLPDNMAEIVNCTCSHCGNTYTVEVPFDLPEREVGDKK